MTAPSLVLHGDALWISPYVFTCWVSLEEKKLPYRYEKVSLDRGEQRAPGFRDASLTARVPALAHGDFWLSESSAIVEYLDEAFPETTRMLPTSLADRARARQVMSWIRSDLLDLRKARPTTSIFVAPVTTPLDADALAAADKLLRIAEALVPKDGGPLFGAFGVADADLALTLHRLIANGDPVPERLTTWARAVWARPSVHGFVTAPREP